MRTAIRLISLAASMCIIITSIGCAKSGCDRECLRGFMTQYLDALIAWEAFKVYDGTIHAVEAFILPMPRETPSGWE